MHARGLDSPRACVILNARTTQRTHAHNTIMLNNTDLTHRNDDEAMRTLIERIEQLTAQAEAADDEVTYNALYAARAVVEVEFNKAVLAHASHVFARIMRDNYMAALDVSYTLDMRAL